MLWGECVNASPSLTLQSTQDSLWVMFFISGPSARIPELVLRNWCSNIDLFNILKKN